MDKKLNIMATVKDGLAMALVNYLSLVLTVALYVVTLFIPYINVGTTIAICSLPAEMAKGTVINPLFILDSKYRRNMGEFFILYALMTGAIFVGILFGIIPGLVISIAWTYAAVLFVDKDLSAMDALHESNRLTYGHKWRIFGAQFLVAFCFQIVIALVQFLFSIGEVSWLQAIGTIIVVLITIFAVPALVGVDASIYKQLTSGNFIGEPQTEATTPIAE